MNEKNSYRNHHPSRVILSTIDILPKNHAGGPGRIVTLLITGTRNLKNKTIDSLPAFGCTSAEPEPFSTRLKNKLVKLPLFKNEIKSLAHFAHILRKQNNIKAELEKINEAELNNILLFHTHDIFAFSIIKKFLDIKKISKPILLTLHSPGSYAQEFKQENPHALVTSVFLRSILKTERNAIENCSLLTTPSQGTLDLIVGDNPLLSKIENKIKTKHKITFNGITPPVIPADLDIQVPIDLQNDRYILSSGRLVHSKGFDIAIRGFCELISRHPDTQDVQLLIVGEGPLEGTLKEFTNQLGISKNVKFLGFRRDAMKFLKHAQLFVATTRRSALDLTILEAFHLGVPVITTDSGGNKEALSDNKGGIIVPSEDPKSLGEAFYKLLSNNSIREKIGQEGLKKAKEMFSIEAMIHSYENLYDQYLNE